MTKCLDCSEKRAPDVRWLLDVLSSLNSEHRYFKRGYTPDAPPTTDVLEKYNWMVSTGNVPDILEGLPIKLVTMRRNLVVNPVF